MKSINLLPEHKKIEYALRKMKKYLICTASSLAVICLCTALYNAKQMHEMQIRLANRQAEYHLLLPVEKRLQTIAEIQHEAAGMASALEDMRRDRIYVYGELVNVAVNDFSAVDLREIRFSSDEYSLHLKGVAENRDSLTELVRELKKTGYWEAVSLSRLEYGSAQRDRLNFMVTLTGKKLSDGEGNETGEGNEAKEYKKYN
jgi:Tfp pilus assembly protein PilN